MKFYLPDTNIFIYAYHGEEPYASHLHSWIIEKKLLISSIVAAEFLSGGEFVELDKFQSLVDQLNTTPVDTAVARVAADYKRLFSQTKPKLKLPDALIAATCKLYGAVLVTENNLDYPMTDIEKLALT